MSALPPKADIAEPSSLNNKSIVERDAKLLLGAKAMQQNCCIAASFLLPKI